MEEPYKKITEFTEILMKETPVQQPSEGFLGRVMQSIETQKPTLVFEPLISKRVWLIIGGLIFFGSIIVAIILLSELKIESSWFSWKWLEFTNPFSEVDIPNIAMYGFVFLLFFLLQIPFIKKYVGRHYQ